MAFRGFDTDIFPGFDAMAALRPCFDVTGYYLRAPSHPDQSWSGKLEGLRALKYGLLPTYVAQQTVGPGSHIVTAEQGAIDGAEAAAFMAGQEFAPRSRVFLDLENGPPFGGQQPAYVAAVVKAVEAGGMTPACYVSHAMAAALVSAIPDLAPSLWIVRVPTVARTTAAAPFLAPNPFVSGYSNAVAWQYRQNVEITVGGHTLVVDLDAAVSADPSAPG